MAISPASLWRRHRRTVLTGSGLLLVVGLAYLLGRDRLDPVVLIDNYGTISRWVASAPLTSGAITFAAYTVLVVLLLPGVPLMTVPLGLVLGWAAASAVVTAAMMAGVSILFFATVTVLPASFTGSAGRRLGALAKGFRSDAVSYLLFLRLMPAVPFTLLNVALPALKVPYPLFALTTFLGMAPRIGAYAYAGEGLRSVIAERNAACARLPAACDAEFSAADFLTREMIVATLLLCVVALAPLAMTAIGRWRASRAHPSSG